MRDLKEELCYEMHRFVKNRMYDVIGTPESFGFNSKTDLLRCVKSNWIDAAWALTEMLRWGFKHKNLDEKYYFAGTQEENIIYQIVDRDGNFRYFKIVNDDPCAVFTDIVEVKKVAMIIEVVSWETV